MSINCMEVRQAPCASAAAERGQQAVTHRHVCTLEKCDMEETVDSENAKVARHYAARRVSLMGLRCAVDAQPRQKRRDVGRG